MFPLCSAPTAMTTTARLAARAGVMRVTARQRKRNTRPRSRDTSAARKPIRMQAGNSITSPNRTL